jgi:hypothetical protein
MNVDSRLQELAPSHEYSTDRAACIRVDVLARATALNTVPERRSSARAGRRWMVSGIAAVAAVSALLIVPTQMRHDDAFAANALTPLARAAERTEVPALANRQVLHRITDYRQTVTSSGAATLVRWEEWTLADGTLFRQTTVDGKIGPVERWANVPSTHLTPSEIAALPTNPADLLVTLRNSPRSDDDPLGEQALLGTIIYDGYAPTGVWAAAIEAYGSFDDVEVRTDKSKNLTYVNVVAKGGPLAMRFDSTTGQLRGYESTSPQDGGRSESMTVRLSRVEEELPPRVVDEAVPTA